MAIEHACRARISRLDVERWMGWTLALLVLREMLPSDSAPSINGVVGSSLYISTAVDYFIAAQEVRN